MKKLLAIILMLAMLLCVAEEEADTSTSELQDGEILMHGYISPFTKYYIGVPAEWYIIGAGSTNANLSEASEALDDVDVYGLYKEMQAGNDTLYAMTEKGTGLILTCGKSSGIGNDALIDNVDAIKAELEAKYSGITFDTESGSYTYNSLYEILYLGMNYKNREIIQYYLVAGSETYVFTFIDVASDIAETVLSTFTFATD